MQFRWTPLLPPAVFILFIAGLFFLPDELAKWWGRVPGAGLAWEHRWWIFAVAAIGAVIAHVVIERRRTCPACGVRGFARVYQCGARDDEPYQSAWSVRHCLACGMRQVDCVHGKYRLPEQGWFEQARFFAHSKEPPRMGFEVMQKDDTPRVAEGEGNVGG